MPHVAWHLKFLCHAWVRFPRVALDHLPLVAPVDKPHATRGIYRKDLMPHVASNLKFMCHAWAKIPRVARDTLLPGSLTTRGLTPHAPPPPGACATRGMHAARSAPYRGARATRGLTPHAPPPGGACATRHVACTPHAPPLPAHVPRVASHRTRRPSPCLCATRGLTPHAPPVCHA